MNSTDQAIQPQPAAELQGVGVLAGGRWIVRDVQLALPAGVCCALVGPNGCGKSTLARVLAGFVWATAGSVSVLGRRFGQTDLRDLRRMVKLVQPNAPVDFDPALPARDVVISGAFGTIGLYDRPSTVDQQRAGELMTRLNIAHLAGSTYGTLSTGERMRALIARALMQPPALLLLDEATAGLDLVGREQLLAALDRIMEHDQPPTILMISHHLEELPRCTAWAALMREGRLLHAGPIASVFTAERLGEAFAVPLRVARDAGRWTARMSGGSTGAW